MKDWQITAHANIALLTEHIPFGGRGRVWHSVLASDGVVRPLTVRVAVGLERLRWLGVSRTMFERTDDGAQC